MEVMRKEWNAFSKAEKLFIFFVMICGFCISAEYAITRPASNAFFISAFSVKAFPYAWLATIPLNFFVIYLYNRFLVKLGYFRTLGSVIFAVIAVNLLSVFLIDRFPVFCFFQYIWKDIYILLMFKQLWSMIHTTIPLKKAKYLYGIIFGIGGFGSLAGSLAPGFLAVHIGSSNLFLFTLPFYATIFFVYRLAMKRSFIHTAESPIELKSKEVFSLIRNSKILVLILLLVIFMQMSIAFLDFQFNDYLEKTITTTDLKTQYMGRLISIINTITMCIQFFGGFFLIHFFGLKRVHLAVPCLLFLNAFLLRLFPGFAMASTSYVSIKTIDYSVFSIIREMLYVPMSTNEKFRAKAVIDVFAYRSAKAFASLFLLSLQFFFHGNLTQWVSWASIIVFVSWALSVAFLFKYYERRTLQVGV